MEKAVSHLYESLQKLVGLHRQLLENVRAERQVLVQADLKGIQDITCAKQALIETIRQAEAERLKKVAELAAVLKKSMRELTLPNLIIEVQGRSPKLAEQLRSAYNALTILVQRISDQNDDNRVFVEKSLEHVRAMKKNVLGETAPKANTYNPKGRREAPNSGARFVSKEA